MDSIKVQLFLCLVIFGIMSKVQAVSDRNVACYYINSNGYSLAPPEILNPHLCTHIYYAFVEIDETGNLTAQNEKLDIDSALYERVVNLKTANADLKVLLSVGGVAASLFSSVAQDPEKRRNFVESADRFLRTYSFDGLDIDWEKPKEKDAENFVTLLKEIKEEFVNNGWLLTAAVYPNVNSGYNVKEMAKYLDLINVMTYNFYGSWSQYTGQNAALYSSQVESSYEKKNLNTAASVKQWLDAGAAKEKILVGMPFYGRSFTLEEEKLNGLHAPIKGAGNKPSSPTYYQIKKNFANWTTVWDDEQKMHYKYLGDQWLGYDDELSIKYKSQFVVDQDLGGAMVWHIGGDDVRGEFGEKQGLLRLINNEIRNSNSSLSLEKVNNVSSNDLTDKRKLQKLIKKTEDLKAENLTID